MAEIHILDVHLGVLAGKREQKAGEPFDVAHPLFYGTAFPIAPRLFLTAAHVYQDAIRDGLVALARLTEGPGHVGLVGRAEVSNSSTLRYSSARISRKSAECYRSTLGD